MLRRGAQGHILSTEKFRGDKDCSFSDGKKTEKVMLAHFRFPHFPRIVNHQVLEKLKWKKEKKAIPDDKLSIFPIFGGKKESKRKEEEDKWQLYKGTFWGGKEW